MRTLSLLAAGLVLAATASAQDGADAFFESRIRPVLVDNCLACHVGDSALAGLKMDSRANLIKGGDSGPALLPGKPHESLLITAVRRARDDLQMPLGGDKLDDRQIEDLIRWVEMGAPWPETAAPTAVASEGDLPTAAEKAFWSFQPLSRPVVPAGSDWSATDIDRFIEAARLDQGLEPVAFAGKRELLRRVSFDLTGLPPTPEEVAAFLADTADEALAKVVDRLLDSPQYGERWGRHWLDVVRFGEDDTRGLAKDGSGREVYASAYVFRDWVIQAMNRDMPYDVFVRSHFAGDLLEEEGETVGGLGFLGGGPWYYDIAEPAVARADERHDRVDVTTRGFLGLTVGCARCHDHKFDPISTKDYYAMAGVFYNTDYEEYPVAPDVEVEQYKKEKEYIDTLKKALTEYLKTESEQLARVLSLDTDRYMVAAWNVMGDPEKALEEAANEDKLDLETLSRFTQFLAKEPKHYPYLVEWQKMLADDGGTKETAEKLAAEFERVLLELVAKQKKIEEKNEWIIANGSPPPDERKSVPMPNEFKSFFDKHQLELESMEREEFNLLTDVFKRDLDGPIEYTNYKPGLLKFGDWSLERRLSRVAADHVAALHAEIEKLEKALPKQYPFVMGVKDRPTEEITNLGVHIRGSPHNLGEKVPRHFPSVLSAQAPEPFAEGSGRRELGEAIASHPITARVIVNRVWRWHFGTGIVNTPSNFGRLGERPKHPELIEHLASWFVDNGMSLKKLHREILLSSVYRLGTEHSGAGYEKDPANRYYWRTNRRRLDAEAIRDTILYVSGSLDLEIGGAPLELGDEKNLRRTVYGRVGRFRADDYLQTFDFPNPSITAERRFVTNVPLQSLFFMNSELVTREAGRFVYRLAGREPPKVTDADDPSNEEASESKDPSAQPEDDLGWLATASAEDMIRQAYRRLYTREVTAPELAKGLAFLSESKESEDEAEGAAEGETEDKPADQQRFDTWVAYLRVLLGTNEFRFVS